VSPDRRRSGHRTLAAREAEQVAGAGVLPVESSEAFNARLVYAGWSFGTRIDAD
jgi:hypothetical protein